MECLEIIRTMDKETEDKIASLIIEELKKNQCTLENYKEISQKVQGFFERNAVLTI